MAKKRKASKSTPKPTEIVVVLDRSGSMGSIKDDAIGGFNHFLTEQQKLPGKAWMTLVQFDDEYETVHDHVKICDVPKLTNETYQPRSCTALLDAIGRTIVKADALESKQVSFVILTDGLENVSKEYNRSQIFDMIKERKDKGWLVIFLAANQDAIASGSNMGISHGQALTFANTGKGVKTALHLSSTAVATYRAEGVGAFGEGGSFTNGCFTEEERTSAKE